MVNGSMFGWDTPAADDGAARLIQLRELMRQGVQLIEAAVSIKEGFQFLKLRIPQRRLRHAGL